MQRKLWDEATAEEARTYASVAFGVDVTADMTVTKVRAALSAVGYTGDSIVIYPRAGAAAKQSDRTIIGHPPSSSVHVDENGRTFVCVIIPNQDKPGGQDAVPVAVNGSAMFIARETASWIAEEYHEALINAQSFVHREYDPDRNPMGGLETDPQRVQSFPIIYATAPFTRPRAAA